MSDRLRKSLDLDYGDWLIFNTKTGPFSVMVTAPLQNDLLAWGEDKAFVNEYSPALFSEGSEVFVENHRLTIGADLEFFILDSYSRVLEAYKVFPFEGELGNDGDLGEIRPNYAFCPEQLTQNIKKIITTIPRRLPIYLKPVAASFYANRCCGFHIHLGMPIELLSFAAGQTDRFLKNIVATFDYLVGIPASVLDDSDRRRLPNLHGYGKPGDYRLNMRTLEYRTPGGFHLKSPEYTKNLLSIAFCTMDKIIKEAEEISGGWVDMGEVAKFDYFKNKYNIPSKDFIRRVLTSKNRKELEQESVRVFNSLPNIMGEYSNNLVTTRKSVHKPLINEWAGDET
jgi:hypothetical protein